MDTAPLKAFATWARTDLIKEVAGRLSVVLAENSLARVESVGAVRALEAAVARDGVDRVVERVAYTWFNRIIALRFMDANGYTASGVVSPAGGQLTGQPEVLAEAKAGVFDSAVVPAVVQETITALFNGTRTSQDRDGEAYGLLLEAYCRSWNESMPFMFEREGDYTELLIPTSLLAAESVRDRAVKTLTVEVCQDVEVIGWLYQFYISERKDEVFAGFKKNKKAGAAEIPAATQLFTPHWIVRYLVENSLGRLWLLNNPTSSLAEQMEYYIKPVDEETDFLKISTPEELKIIDPAVGSGHMLTYAFDLLYAIYTERGYDPAEIPGLILQHNLYGTEIDPRAGALAGFALTMKAAARRKLFLKNPVQPNICVLENIHFDPDELDYLWSLTKDANISRADADEFWNAFEHADTIGSLIQPWKHINEMVDTAVAGQLAGGDLLHEHMRSKLNNFAAQAGYLLRGYSVVIGNPPYMSGGTFEPGLARFAKAHYPDSKSDLFAMFISRAMDLTSPAGHVAMITMQSWMFLGSYESLRKRLLRRAFIANMAHLGSNAFDSIAGEVVSTSAFVLRMLPSPQRGVFLRLVRGRSEREKAELLAEAIERESEYRFEVLQDGFEALPASPITYWLGPALKGLFERPRLGDKLAIGSGLSTADNSRFLRFIWEVSRSSVGANAKSTSDTEMGSARWYLLHKGGEFRKWYGNLLHVVNWERDGAEIKKWVVNNPRDPDTTQWSRRIFNTNLYFKPGIVWSTVTSGKPSFRLAPAGTMISNAAGGVFDLGLGEPRLDILGALNSNAWGTLIQTMNPTVNFSSGVIQAAPLPSGSNQELVARLCAMSALDWAEAETSWDFEQSPLVGRSGTHSLSDAFDAASVVWRSRTEDMWIAENQLNSELNDAHGLSAEVPSGVPIEEITLTCNPEYRYRSVASGIDLGVLVRQDAIRDFVSYAVGCMFGRYSVDKPGLILADQGSTLQDYLAQVPTPTFHPDQDNVIPIVDGDWFEDDIVARFRQYLRVVFGKSHFEANLRYVTDSLGVKDVREYFLKSFYDDHVKRYKKRPIYWLFRSPKGAFSALIYLHRYSPSTVSVVLAGYLREFIGKLESNLEHQGRVAAGAGGATTREVANAHKESDRIRKVLFELREYEHEILFPLAGQQIHLDLDDGVLVNYQKLGPALRDIGLKKDGGDE